MKQAYNRRFPDVVKSVNVFCAVQTSDTIGLMRESFLLAKSCIRTGTARLYVVIACKSEVNGIRHTSVFIFYFTSPKLPILDSDYRPHRTDSVALEL